MSAALLSALALALIGIGERNLWLDEASSVLFAERDWSGLWQVIVHGEPNMSLYYVLLKLWLVLGPSEFAVRSLSVVFAVASLPVVYALTKQVAGVRTGLTAVWILALNPFFIHYAQQARGYTLVLFLVCSSSYLFIKSVERPRRLASWAMYALCSVLAVYAHFFGVLVIAAHATSLLFLRHQRIRWKALLGCALWISLCLIPLGVLVLAKGSTKLSWVPPPDLKSILSLFSAYVSASRGLMLIYGSLFLVSATRTLRSWWRGQRPADTWRDALLLSWLFVPIVLAFAVSLLKPVFVERYLIVSLPAFVGLVSLGLTQVPQRWLRLGLILLTAVFSLNAVSAHHAKPYTDWKSATPRVTSSGTRAE